MLAGNLDSGNDHSHPPCSLKTPAGFRCGTRHSKLCKVHMTNVWSGRSPVGTILERCHSPAQNVSGRRLSRPYTSSATEAAVRVTAIEHIQLAMPAGREVEAREFYQGLL